MCFWFVFQNQWVVVEWKLGLGHARDPLNWVNADWFRVIVIRRNGRDVPICSGIETDVLGVNIQSHENLHTTVLGCFVLFTF